ncbi:MAG: UDP-glucose/GDP-mannose dehydrogenase family protein [Planctomycetia bacterium]|nr:UDP-glucose/GDP-mannose dehydrogenase family protein [Planctomycetia bacterium]
MAEDLSITVVGTGYVGLVSGTCLAAKGHSVRVLDLRTTVVENINRGIPTIHERGLADLLSAAVKAGRLEARVATSDAIGDADVVLLCVGTPSKDGAIDLAQIDAAARMVGGWLAHRHRFAAVVVKSTVVPGTTDTFVRQLLEEVSGKRVTDHFGLGMNPEFLREGEAVTDFMQPDRIVIGHEDVGTRALLERVYAPWNCEKLAVNTRTAEMIKYANNCLLALQISAVNELANVAAALGGIDFLDVVNGVGLDKRWNPRDQTGTRTTPAILSYLIPGCGFGGSCFPKDVEAMRTLACRVGVEPRVLQAVLDVNAAQPIAVLRPFFEALGGDLRGKTILLLGLAFKPETDDVRESASLRMARHLEGCGARVLAHDPVAGPQALAALGDGVIELVSDWATAAEEADGVIIATRWSEYAALATMDSALSGKPILDARRLLPAGVLSTATHLTVGYRSLPPLPAPTESR